MKFKKLKVKSSKLKTRSLMEIDEFTVAFPSSKRWQWVHNVRNPPGLYPLPSLFFVSVDSKGNEVVCFLSDHKC
jgi:hypothetical protein